MGVPDDANPMHRSLPAETVTRRRKVEKKVEKKEETLAADRGLVLKMKPEQRVKWLSKALQKCQEGGFQTTVLYDIATHAKFHADASDKIAQKMYRALRANFSLFSAKQVRYLQSEEFRLAQMFQEALRGREKDKGRAESPASERSADGGAAGAEGEGVASLWERISQLAAEEQAEAVGKLDAATKERLEDFLVARITRKKEGARGSAPSAARGSGGGAEGRSESPARSGRSPSRRSDSGGGRKDRARGGEKAKEAKGKSSKEGVGGSRRARSGDRRGRRGRRSSSSCSGRCSTGSSGSSRGGRSRSAKRSYREKAPRPQAAYRAPQAGALQEH